MRVSDILSRKGRLVCKIDHDDVLHEAVRLMHKAGIGAIVIVDNQTQQPVGIISQAELLSTLHDHGAPAMNRRVAGIMRMPAPVCPIDATIPKAMTQMTRERTRHLLAVDETGAICGIVSMGDLVAARIDAAELEANVLRDMARSHLLFTGA